MNTYIKLMNLFVVLVCTSIQLAFSQQNFWQHTGGPYKGFANALAVGTDGFLLSGTNAGFYQSSDDGKTWNYVQADFWNSRVPGLNVPCIAPNGTIFVITRDSSLFKSTNRGVSWTSLTSAMNQSSIRKLIFNSNGDIFALSGSNTILQSTNDGDSWSSFKYNLPVSTIHAFAVDSTNSMILAADTNIYRSTDYGLHWTVINEGLINRPNNFAFDHRNHIIAAGSGDVGIYQSFDRGTHWIPSFQLKTLHPITKDSIVSSCNVYSVAVSSNGTIFANRDYRMIRSTDNGNTWTEISGNIQSRLRVRILTFALGTHDEIYAGTVYQGLVCSRDQGEHWETLDSSYGVADIRSILVNSQQQILLGTSKGILRSADSAVTWTHCVEGIPENASVQKLGANSRGIIFAGVNPYELFRSTNNGNTWASLGLKGAFFGISNRDSIFVGAGIEIPRVYRSRDNGDHWTRIDAGMMLNFQSFVFTSQGTILAGSSNGLIFRSTDDGNHWTESCNGLPDSKQGSLYNINELILNPSGYIFACTDLGLFRSTDGGTSWEKIDRKLAPSKSFVAEQGRIVYSDFSQIRAILSTSQGTIFVGYDRGVYASKDNGETWNEVNLGLPLSAVVNALAIDASGFLYAGTDEGSLYKSIEALGK